MKRMNWKGWIFITWFALLLAQNSFSQDQRIDSLFNVHYNFSEAFVQAENNNAPLLLYFDNDSSEQSQFLWEHFWNEPNYAQIIRAEYVILHIPLNELNIIDTSIDDSLKIYNSPEDFKTLKIIHKLSNYLQPKGNLLVILDDKNTILQVMNQFDDKSDFESFLNPKKVIKLNPVFLDSIINISVQYGPLVCRIEQRSIFANRKKITVQAFVKDSWIIDPQEEPDPYYYLEIEENDNFKFKRKTQFVRVLSQGNNLIVKQQIKRKTDEPFKIKGKFTVDLKKQDLKYGTIEVPFEIQVGTKKKRHKIKMDMDSIYYNPKEEGVQQVY